MLATTAFLAPASRVRTQLTLKIVDLAKLFSDIDEVTDENVDAPQLAVPAISDKQIAECADVRPVAEWYAARCLCCDWTVDGESHEQVVFTSKMHVFHTAHAIHIDITNIESVLPKQRKRVNI